MASESITLAHVATSQLPQFGEGERIIKALPNGRIKQPRLTDSLGLSLSG